MQGQASESANPIDRSGELVAKLSNMMAEDNHYTVADWVGALGSLLTILFIRSSPTQHTAQNRLRRLREQMRKAIPEHWDSQKKFIQHLEQMRTQHADEHASEGIAFTQPDLKPN